MKKLANNCDWGRKFSKNWCRQDATTFYLDSSTRKVTNLQFSVMYCLSILRPSELKDSNKVQTIHSKQLRLDVAQLRARIHLYFSIMSLIIGLVMLLCAFKNPSGLLRKCESFKLMLVLSRTISRPTALDFGSQPHLILYNPGPNYFFTFSHNGITFSLPPASKMV